MTNKCTERFLCCCKLLGNVNKNYGDTLRVLCHCCNEDTSSCRCFARGALHVPVGFCKMAGALCKTAYQLNTKLPLDQVIFSSTFSQEKWNHTATGTWSWILKAISARGAPNCEELGCLLCAFWCVGVVYVHVCSGQVSVILCRDPFTQALSLSLKLGYPQKGSRILLFLPP